MRPDLEQHVQSLQQYADAGVDEFVRAADRAGAGRVLHDLGREVLPRFGPAYAG